MDNGHHARAREVNAYESEHRPWPKVGIKLSGEEFWKKFGCAAGVQ